MNHKYLAQGGKEKETLEPRAAPEAAEEEKAEDRESQAKHVGEDSTPKTSLEEHTDTRTRRDSASEKKRPLTGPEIEAEWKASEDHPLTYECIICSVPAPRYAKPYGEAGAVRLHEAAYEL